MPTDFCVARFRVYIATCNTCCCKKGTTLSDVKSALVMQDKTGNCGVWFSTFADSLIRWITTFMRTFESGVQLPETCSGNGKYAKNIVLPGSEWKRSHMLTRRRRHSRLNRLKQLYKRKLCAQVKRKGKCWEPSAQYRCPEICGGKKQIKPTRIDEKQARKNAARNSVIYRDEAVWGKPEWGFGTIDSETGKCSAGEFPRGTF